MKLGNTNFLCRCLALFSTALVAVAVLSCTPDPVPEDDKDDSGQQDTPENPGQTDGPKPEIPEDIPEGIVRLYLDDASVRNAFGVALTDWNSVTIKINGTQRKCAADKDGRAYIDVPVVEGVSSYDAVLTQGTSNGYYSETEKSDLLHPFSYASHLIGKTVSSFPLYAYLTTQKHGQLEFVSGRSVLNLKIKGSGQLSSVKITEPSGKLMAGYGDYESDRLSLKEGLDFIVLNTTNKGSFVPLADSGTEILIPIAPGAYNRGLEVVLCTSDHKMSKVQIDPFTVEPDKTFSYVITYRPASDLLFYEGFDNFVWGGDPVGGEGTFAMNPKSDEVTTTFGRALTGYETPLHKVSYDMPGAGYIQPDEGLANLKGFSVAEKAYLSSSYVKSRNIGSYDLMYHCQEHQGYISVGTSGKNNGAFEAPFAGEIIKSYKDVKISFDFCLMPGFDDDLLITTENGAVILSCSIDGQEATVGQYSSSHIKTSSTAYILGNAMETASSVSQKKTWHHVELLVNNMNEISSMVITTKTPESLIRGFWLDNFEVRSVDDHTKTSFTKTLRVMYWNIQYGMWADQKYNYNNFVECVSKYKPDVCVWCEAESYYDNNMNKAYMGEKGPQTGVGSLKGGDLTGWKALAKRYGHENVNVSDNTNSNFPQIITSRYPITRVKAINDTGTHPAGLYKINCGKDVYIMSLHLTPGLTDSANDTKRLNEIKAFCNYIIPYQNDNFLMMGDFNTVSPYDKWFYEKNKYPNMTADPFQALEYLHENTTIKDVIHEAYPDSFLSSVREETQRIDYMFASESMISTMKTADFIIDEWIKLELAPTPNGQYMCSPSDHRPIIADFSLE